MRAVLIVVFIALVAVCSADLYQQCSNGRSIDDLDSKVSVSSCTKAPCKLKKGTQSLVTMKFTPEKDLKRLRNTVFANIAGLPFPFIGVDNTNACGQIFEADGTTKAACPLKAGVEYQYKNNIDVLPIYPTVKVVVHWGLTSEFGDEICFEVPARITN
nr:epididymal secretory protein E1 [Onthophagus taurus]